MSSLYPQEVVSATKQAHRQATDLFLLWRLKKKEGEEGKKARDRMKI